MDPKRNFFIRVLLMMLLSRGSKCTILRLPCYVQADFSVVRFDEILQGSAIQAFSNSTDIQCMVKCIENHQCRSYSYNKKQKICMINSKALGDDATALVAMKGWVYKATDFNETKVGRVCKELDPCNGKVLCRDTCQHPFFECVYCDDYHYGLHCDKRKDLDECQNNPCRNGGICTDLHASYKCECALGYTGKNCETEIDECSSLPCFNFGTCFDAIGSFTCACSIAFTGLACETDIDECLDSPCGNGGTCTTTIGSYYCTCAAGYEGYNCKQATSISVETRNVTFLQSFTFEVLK